MSESKSFKKNYDYAMVSLRYNQLMSTLWSLCGALLRVLRVSAVLYQKAHRVCHEEH